MKMKKVNSGTRWYGVMNLFVLSILLVGIISCKEDSDPLPEPIQNLDIASIANLRDLGGHKTTEGKTTVKGLVYRSNQLISITTEDMKKFAKLDLKNDYDLRTEEERSNFPDELPSGVNNVWLNVLKDATQAAPAKLLKLLEDPVTANVVLGNGKIEASFIASYRNFVSMGSAKTAFHELYTSLANPSMIPALFHCTTGKDRTGWAAAALLTLLGVPKETIIKEYLLSNDNILPLYKKEIDNFIAKGGEPSIPQAIFGVKEEYLEAAFNEVEIKYGSIEEYFSKGLEIDSETQQKLRDIYLTK